MNKLFLIFSVFILVQVIVILLFLCAYLYVKLLLTFVNNKLLKS